MPSTARSEVAALLIVTACNAAAPPAESARPGEPSPISRPCDTRWRSDETGRTCRCQPLADAQTAANGLSPAAAVAHFNSLPPLTLATNDGLLETLGLPGEDCGRASATLRFAAKEPAYYEECADDGQAAVHGVVRMPGEMSIDLPPKTFVVHGELSAASSEFVFDVTRTPAPFSLSGHWSTSGAVVLAAPWTASAEQAVWLDRPRPRFDVEASAAGLAGRSFARLLADIGGEPLRCRREVSEGSFEEPASDLPALSFELRSLTPRPCSARGSEATVRVQTEPPVVFFTRVFAQAELSVSGSAERPSPVPEVVRRLVPCAAGTLVVPSLALTIANQGGKLRVSQLLAWETNCDHSRVVCEAQSLR